MQRVVHAYGTGTHRGYLQCFFRYEEANKTPDKTNASAAGTNATPNAGADEPTALGRAVSLQVSAPRREACGILLANIKGLFSQRARHKIGVLREMADEGGICLLLLLLNDSSMIIKSV
jgi:hypothetical protein